MEPVLVIVVALLIPITYLIVSGVRKVKQREFLHRERMRAIETGAANLPPHLFEFEEERPAPRRAPRGVGIHGAIWTGIGAGLVVSTVLIRTYGYNSDLQQFALFVQIWAVPALFVGIALVIYAAVNHRSGRADAPGARREP